MIRIRSRKLPERRKDGHFFPLTFLFGNVLIRVIAKQPNTTTSDPSPREEQNR
jgi:hypothetical protein